MARFVIALAALVYVSSGLAGRIPAFPAHGPSKDSPAPLICQAAWNAHDELASLFGMNKSRKAAIVKLSALIRKSC